MAGCGGSVDNDLGTGGSSGSAGNAGTAGTAGSGAVGGGGAGGVAGSGAVSGSAGAGAQGGSAAVAGSGGAPYCCTSDAECPQWFGEGDSEDEPMPPQTTECVAGVCKEIPPYPQCWDNDDCGPNGLCEGASTCPCGADCFAPDTPGWCVQPPEPYCCTSDWQCGDFMYVPCVSGVCKMPVPGACWTNAECPSGQQCVGAMVCPCGALCATIDTPGKCM